LTLGLAVASAGFASEDDLISRLGERELGRRALMLDSSYVALADDPAIGMLDVVRARPGLLAKETASFALPLAPGLGLRAYRTDAYDTAGEMLVWSGVLVSDLEQDAAAAAQAFDPLDTVVIVRNGDKLSGTFHWNGETFQIRPLKTGDHAIIALDSKVMPPDHPAEYAKLKTIPMPSSDRGPAADTVIRVLVNYTSSAASASGDINGLIALAVAETNQGYTNSGVLIDLILAGSGQVTYTQSGSFSTDLSRYRGTSDGYMDSIHTTRNSVAADVAMLLINNSSSCGLASGIGSSASTAFAVAHWSCATGYYSFGHEIGHLQSARHDPATDPTNSPYQYGHGYQYNGSPKWRTIMAYACSGGCPRLNYWSNPAKLYNGVAMGTTTRSDNTRVLNATRTTIAAFR
jgi:hypothetical protein